MKKPKPIVSGQDAFTDSVFADSIPKKKGKRKMADGTKQAEYDRQIVLTLSTKCPGKWAAVDLETNEIYVAGERFGKLQNHWYYADRQSVQAVQKVVETRLKGSNASALAGETVG